MQFIVADLEWNGAYSRKAHGYFNEIIEIGAVKLNEAMELTSRFHALIKPVVSRKLSEVVTGLTSITAEELDEGGTFQTAVSRLRKWIGGEDAVFLTWSTTDLLVLMENCRYFFGSDRIPFLDRYADLQKYCQLRIEADTSQQMGLSKACERLGISEEDMALHRALDDSVLTGQVLQKVYDPVSFAEQMAVVDDAFYDRITFKNVILSDIDSPLIKRSELRFERRMGGMVLSYAWAAALQQAVVCIGRLLVQGMLTPLGTNTVTGYNMSLRIEQFLFCFSQGVSAAMVVCLSQNLGHGDRVRVRRFYRVSVCVEAALIAVLGTVCFLFPSQIVGLFSDNGEVIAAGARYTGTMAYLYLFAYMGEVIQGFFRGLGRLRLTMVASLLQVVLRVVLSYFLIPVWGMYGICVAVASGWVLLVLIEGSYSVRTARALTMEKREE